MNNIHLLHPHVVETLQEAGVSFRIWSHRHLPVAVGSPSEFAAAIGYDPLRIAKTVLLRSRTDDLYMLAVCSASKRLDLRELSAAVGSGRLEVATTDELDRVLGFPPRGVSPLGAGGLIVAIDEALMDQPTVLVGAGAVGVEIEIDPKDLAILAQARVLGLCL